MFIALPSVSVTPCRRIQRLGAHLEIRTRFEFIPNRRAWNCTAGTIVYIKGECWGEREIETGEIQKTNMVIFPCAPELNVICANSIEFVCHPCDLVLGDKFETLVSCNLENSC